MAGTVVANVLNTDTGLFQTNNAYNGIAKAWVNFAAAAGGATVNSSFNVSSVTRTGTGQYQVTMTTAMPNIYYVALGTTGVAANGYDANRLINIDVWSTSIINITLTSASSGSPGDFSYVGVAVLSS